MEELKENDIDKLLIPSGYETAVIGVDETNNRLVISKDLCVEIYLNENKSDIDEAIEFLEFNLFNSYLGEHTPIFIWEQKFHEISWKS